MSTVSAFSGLTDSAFTDSTSRLYKERSRATYDNRPHMARMTSQPQGKMGGAWCPQTNDVNQSLEIDVKMNQKLRFISTKGCDGMDWYVESYRLEFAAEADAVDGNINYRDVIGTDGEPKVFEGNSDNTSTVQHDLGRLEARYVKIVPLGFHQSKALRWELYAECRSHTNFNIHD